MAYEKPTWASGDVITAEKLNNMGIDVVTIELGNPGSSPTVESCSIPPAELLQGILDGKPYIIYVSLQGIGKVSATYAALGGTTVQINALVSLMTGTLLNLELSWAEFNDWNVMQMTIDITSYT